MKLRLCCLVIIPFLLLFIPIAGADEIEPDLITDEGGEIIFPAESPEKIEYDVSTEESVQIIRPAEEIEHAEVYTEETGESTLPAVIPQEIQAVKAEIEDFSLLSPEEREKRAKAYYDLGNFAYEDNDYRDAEENFKKALQIEADNPFYNHFMGKTYLKTEQYPEAEIYLNKAWEINPNITGLKYDTALLKSKRADHETAEKLFMEIADTEPENALAHYHAGMSLYQNKRYEKAVKYLNNAGDMSSAIQNNAHYYAGICYWRTGEIETAVQEFNYVQENADSDELKNNSAKWLKAAEKPEKKVKKPYAVYAKAGIQYDDNVPLEPLDVDRYSDEGDTLFEGYFSGSYNFINRRDYKIGAEYSHYQTIHSDLNEYDLTGSIFNVYAKYHFNPFTFGFSYIPSYYWVDSESYLRRHQFKPEVIWKVKKGLFTRLSYSFYDNKYFEDEGRSGNANEVFADVYYNLMDKKGYIFGGFGYENNSADRSDEDYGQWLTKLGISLNIPWDMTVGLTGKFYAKAYDADISGVEREDDKFFLSLSLSRKLFYDWLSIMAEFDYTKNDSNMTAHEYERKVSSLSFTASF